MAAGGTVRVVVLAFAANLGIALVKLGAAFGTRSGAMMAEAVHSFADAGNQLLLLLGHARSARPPDERHSLGYGREAYFWALLVAMVLFVAGGLYSLFEAVEKYTHPHALSHGGLAVAVLGVAIVLEGWSLRAAWRECTRARRGRRLVRWAKETGDANLLVVVFEDLAAMAGLWIALAAVLLTLATGDSAYDAVGSGVIGGLLILVAVFLALQLRRLIIGFDAGADLRRDLQQLWEDAGFEVLALHAIWDGPARVLVAMKVRPRDVAQGVATLLERIDRCERAVRERHPQVVLQFVEPDLEA